MAKRKSSAKSAGKPATKSSPATCGAVGGFQDHHKKPHESHECVKDAGHEGDHASAGGRTWPKGTE